MRLFLLGHFEKTATPNRSRVIGWARGGENYSVLSVVSRLAGWAILGILTVRAARSLKSELSAFISQARGALQMPLLHWAARTKIGKAC